MQSICIAADHDWSAGSRTDPVLAELNSIEVPYDHQTSVATYAIASSADTAPHQAGVHVPQLPLHTLPRYHSGLPAWRPLRTDSIASSAILTTGAIVLGDGPDPGPSAFHSHYSSSIHPANEHLQTISEGEQNYSFQEDSVQDWGQGLPQGLSPLQSATCALPGVTSVTAPLCFWVAGPTILAAAIQLLNLSVCDCCHILIAVSF